MKLPALTLAHLETALGDPAEKWAGRCYEIACAVVDSKLAPKGAVAVYGHWLGPVASGSLFDRGAPFVHHGWVLLPNGRVLDPTRWVFEGAKPYLYIGVADHYDEGGNEWRESRAGEAPAFDSSKQSYKLELPKPTRLFLKEVMPTAQVRVGALVLSMNQVFWLANRSPQKLGPHALPIFQAICKIGDGVFIPIDNRRRVEREYGVNLLS